MQPRGVADDAKPEEDVIVRTSGFADEGAHELRRIESFMGQSQREQ